MSLEAGEFGGGFAGGFELACLDGGELGIDGGTQFVDVLGGPECGGGDLVEEGEGRRQWGVGNR